MQQRRLLVLVALLGFSAFSSAQPSRAPKPQTPRQALIEMIAGGQDAVSRHLTIEMQQAMKQPGRKDAVTLWPAAAISGFHSEAGANAQTFETGPVLLAVDDPKTHERFEVQVDSDDLTGDEDALQLSLHAFRDGQEVDSPFQIISQIAVGMKKQGDIWRLNDVTVSARLPVGDPAAMKKLTDNFGGGMFGGKMGVAPAGAAEAPPKRSIEETLTMLAFSEGMYANQHPKTGFTCSMADLVNQSRQMGAFGVAPEAATGTLNGYRLALSGCQGTPAGSFQIVAEPVVLEKGAKAFCTDATHNVRVAEDGRGSTCLASGTFPGRALPSTEEHITLQPK